MTTEEIKNAIMAVAIDKPIAQKFREAVVSADLREMKEDLKSSK